MEDDQGRYGPEFDWCSLCGAVWEMLSGELPSYAEMLLNPLRKAHDGRTERSTSTMMMTPSPSQIIDGFSISTGDLVTIWRDFVCLLDGFMAAIEICETDRVSFIIDTSVSCCELSHVRCAHVSWTSFS